jgi:L-lactate dehydrogenase complex protein LldF
VHWAADAAEHNAIVLGLLRERNVIRLVKSKSMLTEECHLNPSWKRQESRSSTPTWASASSSSRTSLRVTSSSRGAHEARGDRRALPPDHRNSRGSLRPQQLTEAARQHLREKFMASQAGLTGVNFAIAETGGLVVCTNEGKRRPRGLASPDPHRVHGAGEAGPRAADLAVFLRLLARSGTGQPITTYTSHFHGPRTGGELHIVLVDNGRSTLSPARPTAARCAASAAARA